MELKKWSNWLLNAPVNAPPSTALIRALAGGIFFWEGILKFVYVNQGVGRFTRLGFPMPGATATFVACLEIVGGAMLLGGFFTRLAAVPFVIEMLVAMLSTKIALYFGTSPLPAPVSPPRLGAWAVLHEIRPEFAQILASTFLLINGPGPLSLDAWLRKKSETGVTNPASVGQAVVDA